MQLRNILVAASFSALASVAVAKAAKEPNCEVSGKKVHVKDEKACTKKKGTWSAMPAAAAPAAATPAPAEAAPAPAAAAPAEAAPAK
ncbi:MAG: hypothetical protein NTZ90_17725 [Proteobacteria bacterium]|jgi:hypothetical protein|nr:hypothetical protein [Pseudomonadota bacterium]